MKRLRFVNSEQVQSYLDQNRNVIIVGGHFGNWEWVITALGLVFHKNLFGLGMPMTDRFWDQKLTAKRERFGLKVIHSKNHNEYLKNSNNHPFVILMLSDQSPGDSNKSYWMPFLNQITAVQFGTENMANQSDAVVFYYHMNRIQSGKYEVVFEWVTDAPKTEDYGFITSRHTELLEADIHSNPSQWMWSHKRWKREIPNDIDALYAEQKSKFEKKYR
jgi:KDO2-lipid IV(A) lauroyltransferase